MRTSSSSLTLAFTSILALPACAAEGPSLALPTPTGPFEVGVTTASLTDAERLDPLGKRDESRRLTLSVWYPAAPRGDEPLADMLLDLEADDLRRAMRAQRLPADLADALADTPTHSWREAPLATNATGWPVVIWSHGYMGVPELYTSTAEELASRGYVVVSINHPYEAATTAFDTGDDARGKLARFALRVVPQMRHAARLAEMSEGPDKDEATARALEKNRLLEDSQAVWVADTRFVLDVLEQVDAEGGHGLDLLAGGLDLERIAAAGHSFGGSTAMATALVDDRIDAAINWDGFQFGGVYRHALPVPGLFVESAQLPGVNEMIYAASPNVETAHYEGILHIGLSDLTRAEGIRERRREKLLGGDDAEAVLDAVNARTAEFIAEHLGAPSPAQ